MHLLAPFTTITDDPSLVGPTYAESSVDTGTTMVLLFAMLGIAVVSYVLSAWLLGKIFDKAGVESWKAWVPVYNSYVLLELGGQAGWWAFVMFIPLVNIVSVVFLIMAVHQINENFGKGAGMTVLYFFVPFAWSAVLAFDDSKWRGPRTAIRR